MYVSGLGLLRASECHIVSCHVSVCITYHSLTQGMWVTENSNVRTCFGLSLVSTEMSMDVFSTDLV